MAVLNAQSRDELGGVLELGDVGETGELVESGARDEGCEFFCHGGWGGFVGFADEDEGRDCNVGDLGAEVEGREVGAGLGEDLWVGREEAGAAFCHEGGVCVLEGGGEQAAHGGVGDGCEALGAGGGGHGAEGGAAGLGEGGAGAGKDEAGEDAWAAEGDEQGDEAAVAVADEGDGAVCGGVLGDGGGDAGGGGLEA